MWLTTSQKWCGVRTMKLTTSRMFHGFRESATDEEPRQAKRSTAFEICDAISSVFRFSGMLAATHKVCYYDRKMRLTTSHTFTMLATCTSFTSFGNCDWRQVKNLRCWESVAYDWRPVTCSAILGICDWRKIKRSTIIRKCGWRQVKRSRVFWKSSWQ